MVFADGTETVITTVDAGWGRNTWGSFAWNENITQNVSVTGQEISLVNQMSMSCRNRYRS
jgi:hypothetical protein